MKSLRNPRDTAETLSRLQKLSPTSARLWGKMSARQMVCHLNDAFKLYLGLITVSDPGFPYPSRILKWGCLWAPIPWPKGFKTLTELDQVDGGGTRPAEFERDVAELISLVKRFAQNRLQFTWPHPYLGRMSISEWMRLGYLHTDHHLRQFGA